MEKTIWYNPPLDRVKPLSSAGSAVNLPLSKVSEAAELDCLRAGCGPKA